MALGSNKFRQMLAEPSLPAKLQKQLEIFDKHRARASVSVADFAGRPNLDPNPAVTPYELLGANAWAQGKLQSVRWTDPTLADLFQKLQRKLEALGPEIVAPDDATASEQLLAEQLSAAFARIKGGPERLLAHAISTPLWAGRVAYEVQVHPLHWRDPKPFVEFFELAPHTLNFLTDPSGRYLRGIAQTSGVSGSVGMVPAERLYYLGTHRAPGDFEGWAEIGRPFLSLSLIKEAVLKSYLAAAQAARGVPIFSETIADAATAEQAAALYDWINAFADGRIEPGVLPYGIEVEWFSPTGSLPDVIPMLRYLDERAREMALDALSSLGVSATGSRALGEELSASDSAAFKEFVESALRRLNNADAPYSDLLYQLASAAGIDVPDGARWPVISYRELTAVPVHRRLEQLRLAQEAGIDLELTNEDLDSIRADLGLAPLEGTRDNEESSEPVERVDRDLEIARLLSAGAMTPQQAAHAYERNGMERATARELAGLRAELSLEPIQAAQKPPLGDDGIVDWDRLERFFDREQRALGNKLQDVSRRHRDSWIDSLTRGAEAEHEVDFSAEYERVLLERLDRTVRRAVRDANESAQRAGWREIEEPFEAEIFEHLQETARLRAAQLSATANMQLRAALATMPHAAVERWVMPPTITSNVGEAVTIDLYSRAQAMVYERGAAEAEALFGPEPSRGHGDFAYTDGTVLSFDEDHGWIETDPDGREFIHQARPIVERHVRHATMLDRNVCEECQKLEGLVTRVGSAKYFETLPPVRKCHGNRDPNRGNQCRCQKVPVVPYARNRRVDDDED